MCYLGHGKVDRSGEQVPERAERFKKAMDAPGMMDAATDSPNAPERGERRRKRAAQGAKIGESVGLEWLEWWLSGPDPVFEAYLT